ncbi:hypothetical protein V2S66_31640 [Streptomyces sp. V4-01]|uniref:Transposase InsH N-terminal domain-containing protein n=1 Tax=Actinacidiphila polyblastidii TaxID=3110430 RepID=A0ABU7PLA9_9ACTN|nr:hypothetical protein [Streptomyces sp. V4-01]
MSVLQFLLNLPDRQAAGAVRCRIDVKYALAMELGDRADALLSLALDRLWSAGLPVERGRQRTDSPTSGPRPVT